LIGPEPVASQFESPSTTKRHRSSGVVPVRRARRCERDRTPLRSAHASADARKPPSEIPRNRSNASCTRPRTRSCGGSAPV